MATSGGNSLGAIGAIFSGAGSAVSAGSDLATDTADAETRASVKRLQTARDNQVLQSDEQTKQEATRAQQKTAALESSGRGGTILTSPLGVTAPSQTTGGKTLLGM